MRIPGLVSALTLLILSSCITQYGGARTVVPGPDASRETDVEFQVHCSGGYNQKILSVWYSAINRSHKPLTIPREWATFEEPGRGEPIAVELKDSFLGQAKSGVLETPESRPSGAVAWAPGSILEGRAVIDLSALSSDFATVRVTFQVGDRKYVRDCRVKENPSAE